MTLAASLVGWFSFNRVGDVQRRVNEGSVPELAAAFGVAQYGGILANAAPSLAAASTSLELFQEGERVDQTVLTFEDHMAVLEQSDSDDASVEQIRQSADMLISNIEEIRSEVSARLQIIDQRTAQQGELVGLRNQVSTVLIPAIDDQLFYTLTGYSDLDAPPVPRSEHFSEEEVFRYRRLAELEADANIASDLLASAFTLSDKTLLEPLRERFEAAASRIDRNLTTLAGTQFHTDAEPIFSRLLELGLGDDNSFDLAASEFEIIEHNGELLAQNSELSLTLVTEVDNLVGASQEGVEEATTASEQAIGTARTLLLAISGVSVVGALLIIWLFVGKVLLRRIALLSDWMRRMAGGDLEVIVPISGRDEVADMAATLEVFRRHALEVQRLNLVEQLAGELQGKNEQLEGVLAELHRAQDQIVTREKLAALGELTAGVAHEIKNPLNFVKNFARGLRGAHRGAEGGARRCRRRPQRGEQVVHRRDRRRPHRQRGPHPIPRRARRPDRARHADDGPRLRGVATHRHQRPHPAARPVVLPQRPGPGPGLPTGHPAGPRSRRRPTERHRAGPGTGLPEHGDQRGPRNQGPPPLGDRLRQRGVPARPSGSNRCAPTSTSRSASGTTARECRQRSSRRSSIPSSPPSPPIRGPASVSRSPATSSAATAATFRSSPSRGEFTEMIVTLPLEAPPEAAESNGDSWA